MADFAHSKYEFYERKSFVYVYVSLVFYVIFKGLKGTWPLSKFLHYDPPV